MRPFMHVPYLSVQCNAAHDVTHLHHLQAPCTAQLPELATHKLITAWTCIETGAQWLSLSTSSSSTREATTTHHSEQGSCTYDGASVAAGGWRAAADQQFDLQVQQAALQLFMACDMVLICQHGMDLDTRWLEQLKHLQVGV